MRDIKKILRGEFDGEDKPYKEIKCECGFVRPNSPRCSNCGKEQEHYVC
jgi:hypothetical protein